MYAIIRSGGKQYRVHPGQTIEVEKLAVEPGQTLDFPEVLLVAGDDSVSVGAPLVQGAKVTATVLGQTRTPKVTVFKYKPKVRYRRKVGHRQSLTRLRIDSISV